MNPTQVVLKVSITPILFLVGLLTLNAYRRDLAERKALVSQYFRRFSVFRKTRYFLDDETYNWLAQRLLPVYDELWALENLDHQPPHVQQMLNDNQATLDTLQQIRQAKTTHSRPALHQPDQGQVFEDALVYHIGALETLLRRSAKKLRNPLCWLCEGAESVVLAVFYLCYHCGRIDLSCVEKIKQCGVFQWICYALSLAALSATAHTILFQCSSLTEILTNLWSLLS